MRFGQHFLDEIRDRVPISSVVGARVSWDKRKTNASRGDWWACCPFHGEKSPSFHCEDRKGRYHCFGCGVSGDHFRFLTELEGLSFPEAVERVADMAGVPMPARDEAQERREQQRASLTDVMEMATQFFQDRLQSSDGAKARAYLRERGLSLATQQAFRLGYAPESRNALKEHLASKGVGRDQIEACGLVRHGPDIPVSYDYFRDRIMFPIPDSRGRIIAFGGRALSSDAMAKYMNSPDTELFHKGNVLYNFARARKALARDGTVVAVEGYMDTIALAQAGFDTVVAPLGTALTENQLELLWRMSPEPILCFDGDKAGLKAAYRAADLALPVVQAGRTVRFALLPEGKDPDDLVKADGPEAFAKVLAEARPLADLIWMRETAGGVFETPERRAELEKTLREVTARIRDESVRFHYQQEMRERVQVFFGQGRARGNDNRRGRDDKRGGNRPGAEPRLAVSDMLARSGMVRGGAMPAREAAIVVTLISHPLLIDEFYDKVEMLDLTHPELMRLHAVALDTLAHDHSADRAAIVEAIRMAGMGESWEQACQAVKKIRNWPALDDAALDDARDAFDQTLALYIRERELRKQRANIQSALGIAVDAGEEESSQHLLRVLNSITSELANDERLEALIEGFGVQSGRVGRS